MIASRLATTGLKFKPLSSVLFRSFNTQPKETVRRSFRSRFQQATASETQTVIGNTRNFL